MGQSCVGLVKFEGMGKKTPEIRPDLETIDE